MKQEPSRREFLLGPLAPGALGKADRGETPEAAAAGDLPLPGGSIFPREGGEQLVHITRRAMACEFEICLPAQQYAHGAEIALDALDLVERLEEQMSVFRPTSEISQVNRTAAQRPIAVEPRLFEIIELAMAVYEQTEGAYDITSGPLSDVWGFARRAGTVPAAEQLAEARQRVGGHLVELDHRHKTIRFRREGVQINLGSIGKGYAVDRCAEHLASAGIDRFLVHGGQSSVRARGSEVGAGTVPKMGLSPSAPGEGWTVGLRNPLYPERRLGEMRLRDQALGTSGAQFQFFRYRGRRYGHILDPRTGQPAEGVLSATVLAPTAALADALSTAFYVMGPQRASAYCRRRPEIAAALVSATPGGLEIHALGLSQEQWNVSP